MRVGPTLDRLLREYPNDVRIAYKQRPLPIHSQAMIAAEAAMAAHAQGKFLEMHQKLLQNSAHLSRDKILELATSIGLDMERFTKDLDSHAQKPMIDQTVKEATDIGSNATPTTFVNGRYLVGALPYETFKQYVDEELAKSKAKEGAKPSGGSKPPS